MASALHRGGFGAVRDGHAGVSARGRASGLFGELVAGEYGASSKSLMFAADGRAELFGRSVGLGLRDGRGCQAKLEGQMASALYRGGLVPVRDGRAGIVARASRLFGGLVAEGRGAPLKGLTLTAEGRAEVFGRFVGLGLRTRRAYGDTAVSIYGCEGGGGGEMGGGSRECEGETDSEVGGANG